jgi:hypothetical protein
MGLKPFWTYYGGKYRAAPKYAPPTHKTIIEPFAGAAGYSMRYPDRDVVLVEKYPTIAEMWRYLISVNPAEVMAIPLVDTLDDLPSWVPQGARDLVGFTLGYAAAAPRRRISAGHVAQRLTGRKFRGWSAAQRERVARQVEMIRHWKVIEGDYSSAPNVPATWFIDPPYNNRAGRTYVHSDLDYEALGGWCKTRAGQVVVCENAGAEWLPFRPFEIFQAGLYGKRSEEVIWTNDNIELHHPAE